MKFELKAPAARNIIKKLEARSGKFRAVVKREYILGADRFISEIRAKYYNGREGDVGLNRITSDLYKNWFPEVIEYPVDIVATITNKMNYSVIHEFGTAIHEKRTFVTEEMMSEMGDRHFTEAVSIAMKEAF